MERVFIGSEALAAGRITRHDLRHHCVRVLPGVYASKTITLTIEDRAIATWLWSRRRGVITGLAAAALLGARWVDDDIPVDLNFDNNKAPPGVRVHRDLLLSHETQSVGGLTVTSAARTALDLARSGTVREAVARLDALARATRVTADEVSELARSHPNLRGVRRVAEALDLMDPGAESHPESWLRLLYIEAGFPRPQTQIPVPRQDVDGNFYLDMGWDDVMVASEYEGDDHRLDPVTAREDITRLEYIQSQGWTVIRVVAKMPRTEILRRIRLVWPARAR
ncbi:hypothetical protein [Mycolicibacterium brumae]|uniref:DUF559 domain-containing protein n=1 Tax=Mycolicibacterium brumae TaxID=85968 RepID=A0A2G5PBR9_9MYCO|nr:hypothetical protein [Mycolicibacterium brumae]MCV7193225.1 hypothetical protein [Mycolicibacterium brumae]PIB75510.1 hypothetical protein CQY22_008790 [Mycolicibacterium brumae]RWA16662.1 hypothetical protein MBRU_08020 [Mycolicibacterium brumae DSM 44177]UWW09880.1 hypothetical protein L2Z93_002997 [Mycolicibacterium brumae]